MNHDCGEFDSAFDRNSAGTMVQHKSTALNLIDVLNGANDANDKAYHSSDNKNDNDSFVANTNQD